MWGFLCSIGQGFGHIDMLCVLLIKTPLSSYKKGSNKKPDTSVGFFIIKFTLMKISLLHWLI